jgi:hypothetical protein
MPIDGCERGVGFVEGPLCHRKPIGEGLAHPDLLRSLSRKNECDHASPGKSRRADFVFDAMDEVSGREPIGHGNGIADGLG